MTRGRLVPLATALLAALGGVATTGLLIAEAAAQLALKRDDDDDPPPLLIAPSADPPPVLLAHRSHRSHSSHRSHRSHSSGSGFRSHSSGGGSSGGSRVYDSTPEPPKPVPPKPARVSLVALPGGKITLDGKAVGRDATGTLVLKPGSYEVKVENRFLGTHTATIQVQDGQTGVVKIEW